MQPIPGRYPGSVDDAGSVAFVVLSYLDLVLLFLCLRLFEKAPRDSPRREWLKVFVWGLTTLLTVMYSHKVAAIMPPLVAVVVWAMAFATIGGGFYAFFVHQEKPAQVEQANRVTDSVSLTLRHYVTSTHQ